MTGLLAVTAMALWLQAGPDLLSDQAQQLAMQKRYDEAEVLWKRALQAAPDHFPSLFNLGFMRYSLGQFTAAEDWLTRAARAKPGDFNSRYLLGTTLLKLERREDALRAWRAALAVQPNNYKLMQIMSVEYSNGYYYKEACAVGRQAVALRGDTPEPWFVAIKACFEARDPETLALTKQAAERFPESARANFEYGFQLQKAGLRDESLPFLRKAMSQDPSYEEPFYFYGNLMLLDEQYGQAVEPLRTALKLRPDYVSACVALAKALMGLDRNQEAKEALEACARMSPAHPQPHLFLSQVYFRLGDEEKATAEKLLSLRLRRENPTIMESPQARPFPVTPRR
ncbi:tetratricopeptide repeat protein [Paludibaculum fermentans]|uniref:Tetratricopeptide repeat protein n=1 Tax=Paludibaculum fermentans TaxID=1473598 RepID=A0A7S7NMA5_PALFE|nr:tetratricopeptide repeat protein [Paludibaculum fermentans]QOY85739.1 tetratricopeptide repeat protein [Paludibaculum fermentans]